MYKLQKYRGPSTRHTCPSCGRNKCFAYYVDESGMPLLADGDVESTCGRCDHENSRGYHLKPREWTSAHPDFKRSASSPIPVIRMPKLCTIDSSCLTLYRSNESALVMYLNSKFNRQSVESVCEDYRMGALLGGRTVFWQIDDQGRCRTGKVIDYDHYGHRIKGDQDRITWMHTLLKMDGMLPDDWELSQCLFGAHLLAKYPDKSVCLVESEKTALIGAIFEPNGVWLATGGKNGLSGEKMATLKGRRIFVYPDADAMDEWREKIDGMKHLYDMRIPNIDLLNYSADDVANKCDIADLILRMV